MVFYATFLTALFAAMVLVAGLTRWAPKLGLVDVPDARKVHTTVIPRIGGLGMIAGTAVAIAVWVRIDPDRLGFFAGIGIIALFGLWDDRHNLDYRWKFFGQLLAVLVVVIPGHALVQSLSCLHGESLTSWLSLPLTILFLLGATNATNLADGLDGLASGLSLLSVAGVLALAATSQAHDLMLLSLAVAGSTLGFLRYNTHPAMVFMGDTGSQFLGFSLGVLTVWLTQNERAALAPELPLLILGLPVIDTLTVMAQRLLRGQSPFKPDRSHFHHKLLNLGFDHYEAVLTIYLIQTLFVVSAYLLRYESAAVILSYYGVLAALLVAFYPLALRSQWRLHRFRPGEVSRLTGQITRFRQAGWLRRVVFIAIGALIMGFLLLGSFTTCPWASQVARYTWVIMAASLIATSFKLPMARLLERLALYTLAILANYTVAYHSGLAEPSHAEAAQYFFVGLAALTALAVYLTRGEYFRPTPSDYLVMGILLAAAYLPALRGSSYTRFALESAVLLYGIEFIMRTEGRTARLLWFSTMAGLAAVGMRELL